MILLIEFIRVSEGTGAILGLWNQSLDVPPTTGYIMPFIQGRCTANCKFCPQARESNAGVDKLSRVNWPKCKFMDFIEALKSNQVKLKRICIQALNHPDIVEYLSDIVTRIRNISDISISVSCQPLRKEDIGKLSDIGIDRLGIPLDAVTKDIFNRIKGTDAGGPYRWENHIKALEESSKLLDIEVSTHLIIGLGETEREAIDLIQFLHDLGITVGLFAFTSIPGTQLAGRHQPSINSYRRIQLAHYLIVNNKARFKEMEFDDEKISDFSIGKSDLLSFLNSGEPFQISGCPNCNRPFYNESPSGPIYNYPRKLDEDEIKLIKEKLNLF